MGHLKGVSSRMGRSPTKTLRIRPLAGAGRQSIFALVPKGGCFILRSPSTEYAEFVNRDVMADFYSRNSFLIILLA
jgi:hypothetical protein